MHLDNNDDTEYVSFCALHILIQCTLSCDIWKIFHFFRMNEEIMWFDSVRSVIDRKTIWILRDFANLNLGIKKSYAKGWYISRYFANGYEVAKNPSCRQKSLYRL